jgi:hypothetical protein
MEKHLNKQIENYIVQFKNDIGKKINELDFKEEKEKINELIGYVYEYTRLQLDKDDITKRKRVKNSIPNANRCIGKLANNERCTRRKKKDSEFCGTHVKGIPNGCIQTDSCGDCNLKSIEVVAKEYSGIVYYVDQENNIYKTEDVLSDNKNPSIIGRIIQRNGTEIVEIIGE